MTQILYITSEYTDYLQDQILLGFKRTDEVTCIDYPKKDVLYQDCSIPDSELHGNGFTIWKTLREDEELNRNNIYDRLYNSEFDILIFGSIQRQADVFKRIDLNDIDCPVVFLDGEDKRYLPSFRESIPFVTEWLDRYKRGMGGRPQIGQEYFEPALDNGFYFKREKSDFISKTETVHPISFSIPEKKILDSMPEKNQIFQTHVQCDIAYNLKRVKEGCTSDPIFDSEMEYYNDLAASKYGITMKKGGWECMRHYEIAANWTVPCFYNLTKKPSECAPHGLRDMKNCITFDDATELRKKVEYVEQNVLYNEVQKNTVQWVRKNTCKRKANYVLKTAGSKNGWEKE
jgi:hypothetical protein